MFCPYLTGFALYLIKTINNNFKLLFFIIDVNSIFLGIFGTFYSIIYGFLKKESEEIKNPDFNCCNLYQMFGYKTIICIIANLILPGIGTFSLLCKNNHKCDVGIFFTAIIQFINGIFFHYYNIVFIFNDIHGEYSSDFKVFYSFYIFSTSIYYSGIYIILYIDYFIVWPPGKYYIISAFAMTFLNIFSGGICNILQISNYRWISKNSCCKCTQSFFIILWTIIGLLGQSCIFVGLMIADTYTIIGIIGLVILYLIPIVISIILQFTGMSRKDIIQPLPGSNNY